MARRRRGRGDRGDRRHGRRHREPALPGGGAPVPPGRRPRQRDLRPPGPRALHRHRARAEDQAHAAQRARAARHRHPARHPALPHRPLPLPRHQVQARPLLRRARGGGHHGQGRGLDLRGAARPLRRGPGRDRAEVARPRQHAAATWRAWETLVAPDQEPEGRGGHRRSSASTSPSRTRTRASTRRSPTAASATTCRWCGAGWRRRSWRPATPTRKLGGRRRHPGPGRLRHARHRRHGGGGRVRAPHGHARTSASATASSGRSPSTPATCAASPARTPPRSTPNAEHKVIYKLQDLLGVEDLGGTMRLGSYPCELTPGLARGADLRRDRDPRAPPPPLRVQQGSTRAASPRPASSITRQDARTASSWRSPRSPTIPGSSRCSSIPSSSRKPLAPHPLFADFVRASLENRQARASAAARRRVHGGRALVMPAAIRLGRRRLRRRRPALPDRRARASSRTRAIPGQVAARLKEITGELGIPLIFKASYDKANRSQPRLVPRPRHGARPRDPGRRAASATACPSSPTCTRSRRWRRRPQVADVLQIPAFLCRQTDLVLEAARTRQAS